MNSARTETILILEDDEGVARLQQRRLERAGFATVVSSTPQQALEQLHNRKMDLLVLDNRLAEGEDGLGFYLKLKSEGLDLPVVLVTGYSDDATLIRALRAGVRDYLFKSVEYLDYLPEACRRILDHERVARDLARSQARIHALVHSARDGIITLDESRRVTLFNPAAERIFGCSSPDALGAHIERFVPAVLTLETSASGPSIGSAPIETEGLRADGRPVPLELSVSRIELPGEVQFALILRDVTQRKRAEEILRDTSIQREQALVELRAKTEELRSTTQQLWQVAKLSGVGELAASVAHELNNPLGIVSLRIEGVLAKTPADDPRRRPLEVVEQELERMARLVGNLLHFSRAGRDRVSTVDVCEEVAKTIELTEHHLTRRGVRIEPEFASDIPLIQADRQHLRQVFLNLFTNAGDAMPKGGRLIPRVRPGDLPGPRPAVVVEVVDTGVGIKPEHLSRVSEPFFTTKEEGKGTGLGLAICRRIVEQHKGRLEIESKPGEGTTVRIVLPVRDGTNVNTLRTK
jgi:PAS domain S-box-containing protein